MTKIVIDGNIGSGKTTQLKMLENKGHNVVYEPIDKWPLETFYSDMERWGFLFQMVVLQTLSVHPEPYTIYERCPLSSRDVFWKTMKKTDLEDEVYQRAYELQGWGPDIYILIDKDPKLCHQHINQRVQSGDGGVTLEYLESLDSNYKDMFESIKCPKYIVDGNQSIEEVSENIQRIISKQKRI